MKQLVFKFASIISAILLATTACADPAVTRPANNVNQSMQTVKAAGTVNPAIESQLRQILTETGIKTQTISVMPSHLIATLLGQHDVNNFPVNKALTLHLYCNRIAFDLTADGKAINTAVA